MDQDDGKARGTGRLPATKGNRRAPAGRNGFKRRQIAEVDFFERIVHRCKLRRRVFGAERDHAAKDCDNDRNQTPSKDKKYVHRRHSLDRAVLHPRRLSLQGVRVGHPAMTASDQGSQRVVRGRLVSEFTRGTAVKSGVEAADRFDLGG